MTRAFSEPERSRIDQWQQHLIDVPALGVETDDSPLGQSLTAFVDELKRLVPDMVVTVSELAGEDDLPAMAIAERVRFHGVPTGTELDPFLETLAMGTEPPALPPDVKQRLAAMTVPAHLRLFVAEHCPHCPSVVRQLAPLALGAPTVSLDIIDAAAHPELVDARGIKSVPTLVLDDVLRWTGAVRTGELVTAMTDRDPAQLGPDTLRQIIASGRAADLADMMVTAGAIFPSFMTLLTHDKWPVRLGAMVTAEEIHARHPSLAEALSEMVLEQMDAVPEAVQGDMLYLLGEIGTAALLPHLQQIADTARSDAVREAAEEAVSAIGHMP